MAGASPNRSPQRAPRPAAQSPLPLPPLPRCDAALSALSMREGVARATVVDEWAAATAALSTAHRPLVPSAVRLVVRARCRFRAVSPRAVPSPTLTRAAGSPVVAAAAARIAALQCDLLALSQARDRRQQRDRCEEAVASRRALALERVAMRANPDVNSNVVGAADRRALQAVVCLRETAVATQSFLRRNFSQRHLSSLRSPAPDGPVVHESKKCGDREVRSFVRRAA